MRDVIETIGGSTIQHGPHNDRVYLMHLSPKDGPGIVTQLDRLAEQGGRAKIFAKVPPAAVSWFTDRGYRVEAQIPLGPGCGGLVFVSRFCDPMRQIEQRAGEVTGVLALVRADRKRGPDPPPLPSHLRQQPGCIEDANAIAQLYGIVFDSYPFPIHDPAFIAQSMNSGVTYFTIRDAAGTIAAVSAAEPAEGGTMLEMTDFATDPAFRGLGLARRLLTSMDNTAKEQGISLAFTIARSLSAGMNLTFSRCGYDLAGTLVNNTNISGGLESMNVWYRYFDA
ncbi:MAG: putative beta-lysine N-acetyltransferase [Myxococcota bacterium]|nr:putative beta-lysine N-acetyltransferase [Myxococcota bacterium]